MSLVTRMLEPAVVERLVALQLSARRVVEGAASGLHRSPLKGASVEFRQHRAYVPGDEPRRLDWRLLGRTNRPYVKEYDEETNLRCAIALDCSGSMLYRGAGAVAGKFQYAASLAASLAYMMLARTESVGLALIARRLQQWIPPSARSQQLPRLLEELERAAPSGPAKPNRALREIADHLGRRSVVIIVSDFIAPIPLLREGLARLHHDRHELILLRVLDRHEMTFPFRAPTRFSGLEGEAPQLCEPAVARRTYLDNFRRHNQDLTDVCRLVGGELATFVTDRPMIDELTAFLQRRG
jgi:uncharacterized protein (DUF58 family)